MLLRWVNWPWLSRSLLLGCGFDQKKAMELAKAYTKQEFGMLGYLDGITFVNFSSETTTGKVMFQVFNPGAGGTATIDWLTVDLQTGTVTAMVNIRK
ncbi:hypothetical protein [Paenibacillus koleovorans]|uniref:hypothetical protein n=1 Tax=Paenibacillus koleovorans TaxID=121608 RepID=UPI000FD88FE3|nr:hypothetical protein [Paenibacillus koleovorans]